MKRSEPRVVATMALLRGAILLIAGLFALFAPSTALTLIVVVGGALLIVDGVLGLASQDYGVERAWPFWISVTRNVLAIVAGLAVLFSPMLATVITIGAIAIFVALQAIVIGVLEAISVIRGRAKYANVWQPLLYALLYVAFGVVLLFIPYTGALLLVQIGGGVVAVMAALQLFQTWKAIRSAQAHGSA